jgi:hypothetical protein
MTSGSKLVQTRRGSQLEPICIKNVGGKPSHVLCHYIKQGKRTGIVNDLLVADIEGGLDAVEAALLGLRVTTERYDSSKPSPKPRPKASLGGGLI